MKPPVERIEVPIEELRGLLKAAREKLGAEGYRKLKAAIDTLAYLTSLIEDQKTTIQKLRELLSKPASKGYNQREDAEEGKKGTWPQWSQRLHRSAQDSRSPRLVVERRQVPEVPGGQTVCTARSRRSGAHRGPGADCSHRL